MIRGATGVCTFSIFSIQSVPLGLPLFLCQKHIIAVVPGGESRPFWAFLGLSASATPQCLSTCTLHSSRLRPASLSQTSPLAIHFRIEQLTLPHHHLYILLKGILAGRLCGVVCDSNANSIVWSHSQCGILSGQGVLACSWDRKNPQAPSKCNIACTF